MSRIKNWTLILSALLVLVLIILFYPIMAPAKKGSPEKFWFHACGIQLESGLDGGTIGGIYLPIGDNYFYYLQNFHGQEIFTVKRSEAMNRFPEVIEKIKLKQFDFRPTYLEAGIASWEKKGKTNPDDFLLGIKEHELNDLKEISESTYVYIKDSEDFFKLRWERIQNYNLNAIFEFGLLSFYLLYLIWPFGRRSTKTLLIQMAFFPLLFFLPYYLGYCQYSMTSAGPSGGVLYPYLIMWFSRSGVWTPLDELILPNLPQIFEPLSQTPGPMLSLSGGGFGVSSCLILGVLFSGALYGIRYADHKYLNRIRVGYKVSGIGVLVVAGTLMFYITLFHRPDHRDPHMVELIMGIKKGDLPRVKALLEKRPELINIRDDYRTSPLLRAVTEDEVSIAEYLIQKGAKIKKSVWRGEQLLSHAKSVAMAKLLIKHGEDPKAMNKDPRSGSVLAKAASIGNIELMDFYLDLGIDMDLMNSRTQETALHVAISYDHTDMALHLISKGANVHVMDDSEENLIHKAYEPEMLKVLLDHGLNMNWTNVSGRTPLFQAIYNSNLEKVDFLIQSGANLYIEDTDKNMSPIHLAAEEGSRGFVRRLVEAGVSPNHKGKSGDTPLHSAASSYDETSFVTEYLLSVGGDPHQKNKDGKTPLDLARENEKDKIVVLLEKRKGI